MWDTVEPFNFFWFSNLLKTLPDQLIDMEWCRHFKSSDRHGSYLVLALFSFLPVSIRLGPPLASRFSRFLRLEEFGYKVRTVKVFVRLPGVILTEQKAIKQQDLLPKSSWNLSADTHSEKPFHLRRYSTFPFTTRRSRTFSTTYSSSSSSTTSSTFFLLCFLPAVICFGSDWETGAVYKNGELVNKHARRRNSLATVYAKTPQLLQLLFWQQYRGNSAFANTTIKKKLKGQFTLNSLTI